MKTLIIAMVSICTLAAFSNGVPSGASEKTKKAMRAIYEIQMKRFGGRIRQPNSEKGSIVFVNSQNLVGREVLEKLVKRWGNRYNFVLTISDTDMTSSRERIVIRLEDTDRKERILLAPENFWASVNVRALTEDNPLKIVLESRFEKEVKRAFAFVCGGTCSTEQGGLCSIVDTLSDLDAIAVDRYSPDVDVRISNNMRSTGIKPYRIAKYSDAVQEGWAPAPTNEYQKAIWEKVHAAPKAPMKIEFDPKKGR